MYKGGVIKAGRKFGPGAVLHLIKVLEQENADRAKKKQGPVSLSSAFRQRVRKWKTNDKKEAVDAAYADQVEAVRKTREKGFKAEKLDLWDSVASTPDTSADELKRTLLFLATLPDTDDEEPGGAEAIIKASGFEDIGIYKEKVT